MPRGASPKREREYKEIEAKFEKEGRYKGREEEVAARIVNKQRREAGETKDAKAKPAAKKSSASKSSSSRSSAAKSPSRKTASAKPAAKRAAPAKRAKPAASRKASTASGADSSVPIKNYQKMTVPQVRNALADLTAAQRSKVRKYETTHKNRKGVLQALDRVH
jgi:hypothetical protein